MACVKGDLGPRVVKVSKGTLLEKFEYSRAVAITHGLWLGAAAPGRDRTGGGREG